MTRRASEWNFSIIPTLAQQFGKAEAFNRGSMDCADIIPTSASGRCCCCGYVG
jgi:hypothetical protein